MVQRFATISPGIDVILQGLKETWQRDLPLYRIPGMTALANAMFACITCLPCTYAPPTNDLEAQQQLGCVQTYFIVWQRWLIDHGLMSEAYARKMKRKRTDVSGEACC
jgi:hypothetical protein